MSLELTLRTAPDAPLEAEVISTDRLDGLGAAKAAGLPVHHGNEQASLGDFFDLKGKGDGEIRIEGDLSRVKLIGAGMSAGSIVIEGNAGMHLGVDM